MSLPKTVRRVFHMLKRMACRAQYFEIIYLVVISVSIFVVNPKYFWLAIISAPLAAQKHVSGFHFFTDGRKSRLPNVFTCFINASLRAIFSFMRRRIHKFCSAMSAFMLYRTFVGHGFIVASPATIFSFIGSTGYVRKLFTALFTIRDNFLSCVQRQTSTTAIYSTIFSVVCYSKTCATVFTDFCNSFTGPRHAAH